MKKAVIKIGSSQYLVHEGLEFDVNFLKNEQKKLEITPLLLYDGDKIDIGTPEVNGSKVVCDIIVDSKLDTKVRSIRYKAKKRVNTIRGHRQKLSTLKVIKIS